MDEKTAELARTFFEQVWNERRADAIERLAHPDGISHQVSGDVASAADFREKVHKPFLDAFPDLTLEVEDVLASGEQAVVRWLATGTHLGGGLGYRPTSRSIRFRGMTWLRFRDGRIAEGWDCWDQGGVFQLLASPEGG